jgi:hypothetical protein
MPHTVQVKSGFCSLLLVAAKTSDATATTLGFLPLAAQAADPFTFELTCMKNKQWLVLVQQKTYTIPNEWKLYILYR